MEIQYLRAFHIIFIVTWLAGIYFLGRMLIYFDQAKNRPDVEKNAIQEVVSKGATRVWYIVTLPSMVISLLVGGRLMIVTQAFSQGWFHLKALLIVLFIGYCHYLNRIRKNQIKNKQTLSYAKLRLINELPTLFLAAIVFTVFFRNIFSGLWAAGVVILIIILGVLVIQRKNVIK
jgi:putative membrane protein